MNHMMSRVLIVLSMMSMIVVWTGSAFAESPPSADQSEEQTPAPGEPEAPKVFPPKPPFRNDTFERWKEDLMEKFHARPFRPEDEVTHYTLQIVRPHYDADSEFVVRPPDEQHYHLSIINPDRRGKTGFFRRQR